MDDLNSNLLRVLDSMNVPEKRKIFNLHNLLWLNRNLGIRNQDHPQFPSAMKIIQKLLKTDKPQNNSRNYSDEDASYN